MHEAPLILLEALLRKDGGDDLPEGLCVAVAPQTRNLVVQVALTAERFATFSWNQPCTVQIPPDQALQLAYDLLRVYAPGAAELLEREVKKAELRLIAGGGGPEAA